MNQGIFHGKYVRDAAQPMLPATKDLLRRFFRDHWNARFPWDSRVTGWEETCGSFT